MNKGVFDGVKIVDFGWVGVGPVSARNMADFGATVIRVESNTRPDTLRLAGPFKDGIPGFNRSAFFTDPNVGKYSISLNLSNPQAKPVAERLVRWADAVVSGFTPDVMGKWGLDYENLRKIKPDLVVISTSQQGQTGPHRRYRGYGVQMGALAGFYQVTGWPDREPSFVFGAYTDNVNLHYTAMLMVAGLAYRRRTGKGIYVDNSQLEGALQFFAPPLMDYAVNGRVMKRMGNRDPYAAPHGAYPCRANGRWVAIAVFSDEEWQAFCRVSGHAEWLTDPRFATFAGRKTNEEELDRLVGEWTKDYTAEQVMTLLQEQGVAAGAVQNAEEIYNDPQFKHLRHVRFLEHPEIGLHAYTAPAYRLSKTPDSQSRPAPCLGEHNELVYREMLGYSEDEMAEMMAEGIID